MEEAKNFTIGNCDKVMSNNNYVDDNNEDSYTYYNYKNTFPNNGNYNTYSTDNNYTIHQNRYNTEENDDMGNRLLQLEKDREFLIQKNNELENNIKRLENIITKSLKIKSNDKGTPKKNMENKGNFNNKGVLISQTERIKRQNHNSTLAKSKNKINVSKSIEILHPNKVKKQKLRSSSTKDVRDQPNGNITNPNQKFQSVRQKHERENKELKQQIKEMQRRVADLKDEIKLNNLQEKGDSYLRYELDIWKERTETIGRDYVQNLNAIKKQLFSDKNEYISEINYTKQLCTIQLNAIKEKYQNTINKQNYLIDLYSKQNSEIKKRLDKVRSIFH